MPREPRDRPWVVIFILLSLLAHLLFVLALVLVTRFLPAPKLPTPAALSSVTLSLQPAPPAPHPVATPPRHKIFMPTEPDAQAPKQNSQIESDNDTRLRSQSNTSRLPDSLMPDVTSRRQHPANLHESPNAPNKKPPQPAQTAAQSHQEQKQQQQQQQTPPSPAKQPAQKTVQQPSPSHQQEQKPNPSQQQYDPNGLPVLPAINAQTIAPTTQKQEATQASSIPELEQDVHGAVGHHGDTSPQAMATELGKYKAKVYRKVGALWYHKVDQQFQVMPVGMVHIQFTIYKDGTVPTKVLQGEESSMQILLSISVNSIREASPFDPFTPGMIRDVGDSYTDDFTFSIYGNGD